MSELPVPVYGRPNGFILVEDHASVGATVGTNLLYADGSLVELADIDVAAHVAAAHPHIQYPLLTGGKLDVSVLPALAITDTFSVASQAAMLALSAERGDVAIRSDLSKTFILAAEPASTLGNWKEVLSPTGSVSSVFGRTGTVTAQTGDYTPTQVGLGNVDNTSDANKPVSTATQTALDAKMGTTWTLTAGNGLTGGGSGAANRTVTLGTPSTLDGSTTNSVTSTSHTHALSANLTAWDGLVAAVASTGNTIPQRSSLGDITARLFRSEYSTLDTTPVYIMGQRNQTTDNFIRPITIPQLKTSMAFGNSVDYNVAIGATADTLVRRDASGYITGTFITMTSGFTASSPTAIWVETGSDGFMRKSTMANLKTNMSFDSRDVRMHAVTANATTSLTAAHVNTIVEKSNTTAYNYAIDPNIGVRGDTITAINSGTAGNLGILQGSGVTIVKGGVAGTVTVTPGSMVTFVLSATANKWIAG